MATNRIKLLGCFDARDQEGKLRRLSVWQVKHEIENEVGILSQYFEERIMVSTAKGESPVVRQGDNEYKIIKTMETLIGEMPASLRVQE